MATIDEEISLELEHAANRCRMDLISIQAQYYLLIIQNLYISYLKKYEKIEVYNKEELKHMLETLENVVHTIETESMIDGQQKYDIRESLTFIQECMHRMMDIYGFSGWEIT